MYHSEINSAYLTLFALTGYLSSASNSLKVGWVWGLLLCFGLVCFFSKCAYLQLDFTSLRLNTSCASDVEGRIVLKAWVGEQGLPAWPAVPKCYYGNYQILSFHQVYKHI